MQRLRSLIVILVVLLLSSPGFAKMCITVTPEQLTIAEVRELAIQYLFSGGKPDLKDDGIEYCFSAIGESRFTQVMYQIAHSNNLLINRAMMFVERPAAELNDPVSVALPDSQCGDDLRRWADYAPWHWISNDGGSVLILATHLPCSGSVNNGFTDTERRLWHEHFGGLLTKSEGMDLLHSVTYATADN